MRVRCPTCRRVLIATAAVVMCACGAPVTAHSHQLDDEPAPRPPAYHSQQLPASSILPGATALPPGQQLSDFPAPRRHREIFDTNVPNVTLMLHALARRMPVVYSPPRDLLSAESESHRDPAPEFPEQRQSVASRRPLSLSVPCVDLPCRLPRYGARSRSPTRKATT
jgi:hypothetical protein